MGESDSSNGGKRSFWKSKPGIALIILVVIIAIGSLGDSGDTDAVNSQSDRPEINLSVTLDRSGVEMLDGGLRSWIFDITFTNNGSAPLDLRYFVHGETPTGDVADRGIFPLRARRALTERVKRMDFGPRIGADLLSTAAELQLEPGESSLQEGGILLRSGQRLDYSDVVVFVYDASGVRIGDFNMQ